MKKLWSDQDLIENVSKASNYSQLIRLCGLKGTGGSVHVSIKRRVKELGLDVSHFTGSAWNSGDNFKPFGVKRTTEEILVENSTYSNTVKIKNRCWEEGLLDKKCSRCDSETWYGSYSHLQLDHINGVRTDNRIENLRILCANCHALTDTYCGKNHAPVAQRQRQ